MCSAIAECLALELEQFSIRTLIVAPGSFRTEGIYRHTVFKDNSIPDYDTMRQYHEIRINNIDASGFRTGDPDKAMEVLADVVRGEGVAKGRAWPLYLILGDDAANDVRDACSAMLNSLEEWQNVTGSVHIDDLPS